MSSEQTDNTTTTTTTSDESPTKTSPHKRSPKRHLPPPVMAPSATSKELTQAGVFKRRSGTTDDSWSFIFMLIMASQNTRKSYLLKL